MKFDISLRRRFIVLGVCLLVSACGPTQEESYSQAIEDGVGFNLTHTAESQATNDTITNTLAPTDTTSPTDTLVSTFTPTFKSPRLSDGCGKAPSTSLGKSESLTITVDALEREYLLHLPPDYDQDIASSLMLVFHSYTGSTFDIEIRTALSFHADENGYIVVYPQSTSFDSPTGEKITSWNDLTCNASPGSEGPTCSNDFSWPFPPECGEPRDCTWCTCYDDLAFVGQLLDELEDTLCIDLDRIYATGFSNGAMFVHRLGCDMADRFASIAPVAGTLAKGFNCAPAVSTSISLMNIHGSNDTGVPADGSEGGWGHFFVTVDDVIEAWASPESQNCSEVGTSYPTSGDGIREFECVQRDDCATGSEVVSCTWMGGHAWPPAFVNDVIWEFFSKNSMQ